MAATTSGTLPDRLWTALVPRRSSLRRPSDRAETVARWVALVSLALAVPFLLAFGSSHAQDALALERASSHPVTAAVTGVTPRAGGLGGLASGTADVTASWVGPDGTARRVTGLARGGARVGDPWPVWVDAAGHQVPAPSSDGQAALDGVLIAFWAFLGTALALAGLLALLHLVLDRRRMRDWDEDWALFGLGRYRGMTG